MTLPQLITSYKQKETANRLKKFYTTIAQAAILAEAEYGDVKDWWREGDNPTISDVFLRYKPYLALAIEPNDNNQFVYFRLRDGSCGSFLANNGPSKTNMYFWSLYLDCGKGYRIYGVTSFKFANANIKDMNQAPHFGGTWERLNYNYNCREGNDYGWKDYECFMKIASNNWEVPKDYKWKKHNGYSLKNYPLPKGWY